MFLLRINMNLMDSNWACVLIKVWEKGNMSTMRVCLRSLSCVQAHHTVWRKLRQRAAKPVSATDDTHFLCTHTRPYGSNIKATAPRPKLEEEDCEGLRSQLACSLLNSEWCHWGGRMASSSLWRTGSRFFQNFTSKSTQIPSPHPGCTFNSPQVHSSDSRHLHLRLTQPIPLSDWAPPSSTCNTNRNSSNPN